MSETHAEQTTTFEDSPATEPARTRSLGWRDFPEKGSAFGIALLIRLATSFGRGPARLIVRGIALYYTLFFTAARREANRFLARLGERTGFWPAYRQILRFAQTALDALYFLRGRLDPFVITRDGDEILADLKAKKQGAVLLGAHLGSFYAMRGQSRDEQLKLHPLVFTKNAQRVNDALKRLDPESKTELIEMSDDDMSFMLRIREKVEDGAMLAILADRIPRRGKTVVVDFLGKPAHFPVGPYLLAATLRCPVYFTCGIYRDPNRYELHCQPFADRIVLPRGKRMDAAREYAQKYADMLAEHVRDAPDNWFNFYDFWADPPAGAEPAEEAKAANVAKDDEAAPHREEATK